MKTLNQTPEHLSVEDLPDELRKQTKYTFLKKLGGGEGDSGNVWHALHNWMKRNVALKWISSELLDNPILRERFQREVAAASALEHNSVVRAYAVEEFGPYMIFEMEFVDGKDLDGVVKKKGRLPLEYAVNYTRQTAQGLHQAMLQSLVHRDIKPSNLLLTRAGHVKIANFGFAKFKRESDNNLDDRTSSADVLVGTVGYMAPEQTHS